MDSNEIIVMLLGLGVLLATARTLGEITNRLQQPSVLGEILAGVLLGPTVLGTLSPDLMGFLFAKTPAVSAVLEGFSTVAIVLFLLVAGIDVDLSTVWKQGRTVIAVGTLGVFFPFGLGFGVASVFPGLLGYPQSAHSIVFALFFATALSISALPVIAKTLMDLNLYRSEVGVIVIAAAIFNDLIGWLVFSILLGLMGTTRPHGLGIGYTIGLMLAFAAVMLTLGRWLIHRILPWLQASTSWPGGVLGFAVTLALFCAAFTEWIGIHAIIGSFLLGIAIGDSFHLREHTRAILNQFVSSIFAPIFFASIGLRLSFAAHFDLKLTLIVITVACIGKVFGCLLGARLTRIAVRESWAIGFAMNARGAMEIILGLLALEKGIISERMFVSLVVMALVTSMMSGPLIRSALRTKVPRSFVQFTHARAFLGYMRARDRWEAIRELSLALSAVLTVRAEDIEAAVRDRESTQATGLGKGIAIPHARVDGLNAPAICIGLSQRGIDFDAHDGTLSHAVFLVVTPKEDEGLSLQIYADIIRTFQGPDVLPSILQSGNYRAFLATVKGRTRYASSQPPVPSPRKGAQSPS